MAFKKGNIPWNKGKPVSEEIKERLRQMAIGRTMSKEAREKISKALMGRKCSEETRKKISKSSMGKKGNSGTFKKGHKPSKESIQKMSDSHIGLPIWNKGLTKETDSRLDFERPTVFKKGHSLGVRFGRDKDQSGENHFQWKGGVTPIRTKIRTCSESNIWRENIYKRDNYTCQICGKRGGDLNVDHYPKTFAQIITEKNICSFEDAIFCDELWDINNGRTLCVPCHKKVTYHKQMVSPVAN